MTRGDDAEGGLLSDIAQWIETLAPFGENYKHHATGEGKTNHSLTAPIAKGELDFGTWQQIFYAEFDGNREKRILIKIVGIS